MRGEDASDLVADARVDAMCCVESGNNVGRARSARTWPEGFVDESATVITMRSPGPVRFGGETES